jgi:hypothetical protein
VTNADVKSPPTAAWRWALAAALHAREVSPQGHGLEAIRASS